MNEAVELIGNTIVAEFSDLNDLGEFVVVVIRLLVAALLGGLLGLEREQRGKAAGVRTHMLVCMGAALFILIPEQSGISDSEMSRVIQGVIAGIGFLCAGSIITGKDERGSTGLTTAAGIWFTAAIGVAVGLGREQTAILCTLLAWLVLYVVPFFSRSIRRRKSADSASGKDADESPAEAQIRNSDERT
ncbi:MgtC/SapB family protein [Marinobacter sp.]|uniref:MgtC/SapB family protein n=1 Tax=Marinobacter sp. TaxID=50741 RepID=UPI00385027B6